ncbi:MAG: hypothetical protein HND27_03505 [Bacteroidetes bacterium]|nr:hypothetical protein [Flavobacteriales bacterium]NOG94827.1 hypothetical protein [Bacteroidota bacterium]NUM49955.1 hypothetical protein [Flavobacteriales bacterium]WKZ75499.1 MAG: hypothetical protein QY303_01120 [Vicingaceae bacterium]CAG0961813.1 hypothetical protein FLAV_00741 [Flavobacteriales bacterium]
MNRYHSIMETVWLVIGIITTFISVYLVYTAGIKETWEFLLMPIFAFILFFMRRTFRKHYEKNNFNK